MTFMITTLVLLLAGIIIIPSIRLIGPTEIGLITKRFSFKTLRDDNPVAFHAEAGYQAELLMLGWRFKLWLLHKVEKHPCMQIPAGNIGVVVSQIGAPLPTGAKSAIYKKVFGNFTDLGAFMQNGGQKGVQRPVLPPGALAPIHPVAFLVITGTKVFGVPVSSDLQTATATTSTLPPVPGLSRGRTTSCRRTLSPESFGMTSDQLRVVRIEPHAIGNGKTTDTIGIVTAYEGDPSRNPSPVPARNGDQGQNNSKDTLVAQVADVVDRSL